MQKPMLRVLGGTETTTAWGQPEKTIMSLHRKVGFVAEVVLKEETVAFSRVTVSRETCTVWTHRGFP